MTSIVGCLPKRALQFWRGKTVAECAVDDFGVVADFISKGNPSAAVDHLKRAPDRSSGQAAKTGSDVHNLCERIAKGEDVGRVHPDLQGFVDQYVKFIHDYRLPYDRRSSRTRITASSIWRLSTLRPVAGPVRRPGAASTSAIEFHPRTSTAMCG